MGIVLLHFVAIPLQAVPVGQTLVTAVLATAISGAFAWATSRSASHAAIRTAEVTSRTSIEEEAFERAKSYYTDTIDRLERDLDHERSARGEETRSLRARINADEAETRELRSKIERLTADLDSAKRTIRKLRTDKP